MHISKAKECENRLHKVLIADKHFNPESIKRVMQSDLYYLLSNYAEVNPENFEFDIDINSKGEYEFSFKAKCNRLKIFGSLPE